jgi:predicted transcriptional regulator
MDQKQRYIALIEKEFPSLDSELIKEVYELSESHAQFLNALLDAEMVQTQLEMLVEHINENKSEQKR